MANISNIKKFLYIGVILASAYSAASFAQGLPGQSSSQDTISASAGQTQMVQLSDTAVHNLQSQELKNKLQISMNSILSELVLSNYEEALDLMFDGKPDNSPRAHAILKFAISLDKYSSNLNQIAQSNPMAYQTVAQDINAVNETFSKIGFTHISRMAQEFGIRINLDKFQAAQEQLKNTFDKEAGKLGASENFKQSVGTLQERINAQRAAALGSEQNSKLSPR